MIVCIKIELESRRFLIAKDYSGSRCQIKNEFLSDRIEYPCGVLTLKNFKQKFLAEAFVNFYNNRQWSRSVWTAIVAFNSIQIDHQFVNVVRRCILIKVIFKNIFKFYKFFGISVNNLLEQYRKFRIQSNITSRQVTCYGETFV